MQALRDTRVTSPVWLAPTRSMPARFNCAVGVTHGRDQILNGRWGPYISHGKENFRIPKGSKADELTYMVANAEAKILFVGDRYADMVDKMMPFGSSRPYGKANNRISPPLYPRQPMAYAPAQPAQPAATT